MNYRQECSLLRSSPKSLSIQFGGRPTLRSSFTKIKNSRQKHVYFQILDGWMDGHRFYNEMWSANHRILVLRGWSNDQYCASWIVAFKITWQINDLKSGTLQNAMDACAKIFNFLIKTSSKSKDCHEYLPNTMEHAKVNQIKAFFNII